MDGKQSGVIVERLNWINVRARSIDNRLAGLRDDVRDLTHTLNTGLDLLESRKQFGHILAGLKLRGMITQEDAARLDADVEGET